MNYSSELFLAQSAAELRSGKRRIDDYINFLCDRIDSAGPFIHALLPEPGRRERLLHEAAKLEERYPAPVNRPPLYGIPVGVKDIFRVKEFLTKAGSQLPPSLFEGQESSLVTALKNAGALILGKTVTTEFAYFQPGPTANPYDQLHTPGGSSSGSAAAVACGFTPLALGTQTIGSVNRPAAFCGVYGFKPSFERSATDGIIPFSISADHAGFFTQDIEGTGLAASVLCRNWNAEAVAGNRKPVIGIIEGKYMEQADDEVLRLFEESVHHLEQEGCKVIRLDAFTDIGLLNATHRAMIAAEFAEVHKSWFIDYEELYGPKTRELIMEGREVTPKTLEDAREGRLSQRSYLEKIRADLHIDLWLSPASCTLAPAGLDSTGSPLMSLPWTYMGMPTISVPSGFNDAGLPFGLQFAASFMEDEILVGWMQQMARWKNTKW